ncbi:MAG: group II intron reverse transcriptase/maturase [bacterium]
METREEVRPAAVPERAKQAGEAEARRERWVWAEPSVWTDPMLAALENGVRGGKWFSLIDKVYRQENLQSAFKKVKRNGGAGGVDHVTVEGYEDDLDRQLTKLADDLKTGTYEPQAARRAYIEKPGTSEKRPLGIPTVRDRVCEGALRHVLEPIFEREFAESSYGFRPKRSAKEALREVARGLKDGKVYVVDADIKRYFDTIPHERLLARIVERVADGRVMGILKQMLQRGVLENREWVGSETGTPQGGVISPMLANVYLNPLDHLMQQAGYALVRYADDLVILCATQTEAEAAYGVLKAWVETQGISLHPEKTRIVNMNETGAGFDFLGYHFEHTLQGKLDRWPRRKSMAKLKDRIRGLTHRANGRSLDETIMRINRVTRGWYGYFKHSNRWTFRELDGWIRGRLRAILRKRAHLEGCARGRDHQRWNNNFFAEHGYFSLYDASVEVRQSV